MPSAHVSGGRPTGGRHTAAIVVVDWLVRRTAAAGLTGKTPRPRSAWPPLPAFAGAFAAAVPFLDTGLPVGPVAHPLHGADVSYYVTFEVALALYAPLSIRKEARA